MNGYLCILAAFGVSAAATGIVAVLVFAAQFVKPYFGVP